MKKFYLHDGKDQQGPFGIEDLKDKNITKESSIWYEGLAEWTTAGKVDELRDLFSKITPPPFASKATIPPPPEKPLPQTAKPPVPKKKNTIGIVIGAIIIIAVVIIATMGSNNGGSSNSDSQTYQEKVMTVEEIEHSQPTTFLTAAGTYNETFWGDKIKVNGEIKNKATAASYKDAVVRVTYYSKTKTALGSKDYTIYENFPPHSVVKFEFKIENYKDVSTIGLDVIQASAN